RQRFHHESAPVAHGPAPAALPGRTTDAPERRGVALRARKVLRDAGAAHPPGPLFLLSRGREEDQGRAPLDVAGGPPGGWGQWPGSDHGSAREEPSGGSNPA